MPYKDLTKKREYQKEYQRKWRIKNKDKWKQIVKKFGHHPNFTFDGMSIQRNRRVGGKKQQSNRRVLKYGRRKGYHG